MTLPEFLSRLEESLPEIAHLPELPADWLAFRRQCEAREAAGHERWGEEYLDRDNAVEGMEEASDGANYAWFDSERARLRGGDYDDALQLALIAAQHFFAAHEALQSLRRHTP